MKQMYVFAVSTDYIFKIHASIKSLKDHVASALSALHGGYRMNGLTKAIAA